jgi:hypothetical protein
MKRNISVLMFALLTAASFAQAVKPGSIGVFGSLGGSSSNLGVSYQVSESLALRPSLNTSFSSDPDSNPTYKYSSFGLGLKLDALFQKPVVAGLIVGFGPSLYYSYNSQKSAYSTYDVLGSAGYFAVGALGNVQYLFSDKFGAFLDGNLSLSFRTTTSKVSTSSTSSSSTVTSFGTGTSLGLIYYLK